MKRLFVLLFVLPNILFSQEPSLKHYDELLEQYQHGRKDYVVMPYLAYTALSLKQSDLAQAIASDYIDNYLLKMKGESLYSLNNIDFVWQFNQSSKDEVFKLFYDNADKIDRSIGVPGYSHDHIDYIIAKEEIDPKLIKNGNPNEPIDGNPDWDNMFQNIQKKYNKDYAQRTILNAKLRWYGFKNDSLALAKLYVGKFENYGLDTLGVGKFIFNNIIYNFVFKYSEDSSDLRKALDWMQALIHSNPREAGFIDTYANLLYKLAENEEALKWEEKAIGLAPNDVEIRAAWNRMKLGKPTWIVANERKILTNNKK